LTVSLVGIFRRMARKLRIEYPGAIYHVMNRGDRREDIFHDDPDRELFLSTLTEACGKTEWQVHAYLEPARQATGMAARGPGAGGDGHPQGQRAGAAAV
jgi:hypothetical protein